MVVFAGDFPSGDRTGFTEKTMVVSEVMGIPKNHRFQYVSILKSNDLDDLGVPP